MTFNLQPYLSVKNKVLLRKSVVVTKAKEKNVLNTSKMARIMLLLLFTRKEMEIMITVNVTIY